LSVSAGVVTTTTLRIGAGSTAAPSITPTGDSNTGIFFPSADTIAFGEGGSEAARIDSSGRFGIGTASPGMKLTVNDTTTAQIQFGYSDSIYGRIGRDSSGNYEFSSYESGSNLKFGTTGTTGSTTERARIDSSGRLLVGTSSARTNAPGGTEGILLEGTSSTNSQNRFTQHVFGSSGTDGPYLGLAKTRSTSIGGNTVVQSGDELGGIYFQGADGSDFKQGASIISFVDGTPGANDMPGRLVFSTTADGASSPTERLRIANNGQLSAVVPGASTLFPGFLARAWVNFNGAGTVSIRGNGNVSSITDNGEGDYTVNFTTAMPDANYCFNLSANDNGTTGGMTDGFAYGAWKRGTNSCVYSTGSMRFQIGYPANTILYDQSHINVAIFR